MITTFICTTLSDGAMAVQTACACAFDTAYTLSRRTLVLQFSRAYPAENFLLGREGTSRAQGAIDEDSGMEALLRKVRSQGLHSEDFDMFCKHAMGSSGGMLDVATAPKMSDFRDETVADEGAVLKLLKAASDAYDSVMVVGDGRDEEMCRILSDGTDKLAVCAPQGPMQPSYGDKDKKVYLITSYDEYSRFSEKRMRGIYQAGRGRLFCLPYNVGFLDAGREENVMRFLYTNNTARREDNVNGVFMEELHRICSVFAGLSTKKFVPEGHEWKLQDRYPAQRVIHKESLEYVSVEKKKKLFHKQESVVRAGGVPGDAYIKQKPARVSDDEAYPEKKKKRKSGGDADNPPKKLIGTAVQGSEGDYDF